MQIDLFKPNKDDLRAKWGHIAAAVVQLNTWDTPEELCWLCELATVSTDHLECGAFNGASTKAMMLANPELKITVLDTWDDGGTFETFSKALEQEIADGRVAFHCGLTEDGFKKLDGKTFTTCFIDASHLFDGVKLDIENCLKLVPRGIIAGHDYRHDIQTDGVNLAVHELLNPVHFPVDSIWAYLNGKNRKGFYA